MPRLVRRAPLSQRLKEYLDPYDFYLWLSQELDDHAWKYDELLKEWATPIGVGLNLVYILARGSSREGLGGGKRRDDVFGEVDGGGAGWLGWFASTIVLMLTIFCWWNAFYVFTRKRHYRLFEQPVDEAPVTPSAHRVRVDSSPSSSPMSMGYWQEIINAATAAKSRAHPDATKEVWELRVWDPKAVHLTLFTLFSPGHQLLYATLLPAAPLDPRPSTAWLKALTFGVLLSLQLAFLKIHFIQQTKDSALVHGEVIHEYDAKFVRPNLNRPVRDVGIQTKTTSTPIKAREVDIYTPTTIINRGFRTNPNPNYSAHYDPEPDVPRSQRPQTTGNLFNRPSQRPSYASASTSTPPTAPTPSFPQPSTATPDLGSSPLKSHHERLRERTPVRRSDGGNLGVYSHAASPLRKSGSPLKRSSAVSGGFGAVGGGGLAGRGERREGTERDVRRNTGRY